MTSPNEQVQLERMITAPPERVYRIWHTEHGADHSSGGFEAEITELAPGQRLVFRWGFVGPDREHGPVYDSRLTVTFAPAPGDATLLTVRHEHLGALAAALPEAAASVGAAAGRSRTAPARDQPGGSRHDPWSIRCGPARAGTPR